VINERGKTMQSGYYTITNTKGESALLMRRFVHGTDVLEADVDRIVSVETDGSKVYIRVTSGMDVDCVVHSIECGTPEAALECISNRMLN
jgi:hypothetical protein